ncbi:MAG: GNAT family N-acetyltransferase [Chloroflexales bacterium]
MIDITFTPVPFAEIANALRRDLAGLPSPIDSFLEEHILTSRHYRIEIDGAAAGRCAIHGESLITQFALEVAQRRHGQAAFQRARRLESVQAAFVPTCDELFLSHAIDECRQIDRQAYFFQALPDAPAPAKDIRVRQAAQQDLPAIHAGSGSFFDTLEASLAQGELYIAERAGEAVGFGIIDRSTLYADVASIGMYTVERARRTGVGTATIRALVAECRRAGLRPIAGCWYYNHRSKHTLEAAGMVSASRLLRVSY